MPGTGHDGSIECLAISPDGKWVATASSDSTVMLWSTVGPALVRQYLPHNYNLVTSLIFSPDGRHLVSGGGDAKIKIWNLDEGLREVATLEGHTHSITCCAYSPRGDIIASVSHDETTRLWDAHTFHELHVLEKPRLESDYTDLIRFSPDGHWLVCGSCHSYDVWNVASGTLHKSFLAIGVHAPLAAFSLGSTRLLVPEGHAVKLVDVETGDELAVLKGLNRAKGAALSPDGTLILTGSYDGMVKLWDAYTGVELSSLAGHEKEVREVCFSPCGQYVASASSDGTVRLWRTRDASCVGTFSDHQGSTVMHVTFSPDGETLWSGDSSGTIIVRRMHDIVPTDEQA